MIINEEINTASRASNDTFMALVGAIIPRTPILAQIYGDIMFYGALDQEIDVYLMMNLDRVNVNLVPMTVELLNQAAIQYIVEEGTGKIYQYYRINRMKKQREPMGFSELPRRDRIRTLSLLEQMNQSFLEEELIQKNPMLMTLSSLLVNQTIFGYYSEWYGYGTTRFLNPNQRIFEEAPLSWQQINYPGPSLSHLEEVREYNALRDSV